jgi:hypothetical protein
MVISPGYLERDVQEYFSRTNRTASISILHFDPSWRAPFCHVECVGSIRKGQTATKEK